MKKNGLLMILGNKGFILHTNKESCQSVGIGF